MDGWRNLERASLDDGYANAPHIPGAAAYPDRWAEAAAAFREARPPETIAYGDHPRAALDLFRPDGPPRGLVVFVHGGYWRAFDRSDWSHLARGALEAGHAVAIPGYVLAPEARIASITRDVARAVDAAAARVPGPVRLAGHSAGGHLVARLSMPDAAPRCAARLRASVPISPLSDLRPLARLTLNSDWRIDAEDAHSESPVLGRPLSGVRISVHVGAAERPAFLWQADRLSEVWGATLRLHTGRHHFDVIEGLEDAGSRILKDLLA
ncbi:alpha/beta hydrolase [Jannaschia sp. Os4]|uniref:alpha/beta hydrolase n=1 Tax=Jannaschia sp. Os4 TaxID=2807617 RepID=UPI0019397A89|nr:alpha/beta hydrolase [Jannaschia sp. Os4]MBM2575083.1 alpha/beta hydrolase [Jannaschia sp. Os4]